MAFYGSLFSFDGISCEQYGLMLYDIGSSTEDGIVVPSVSISEDRVSQRYQPLHFGVKEETPLSFSLTFGVNTDLIDKEQYLKRWDIANITEWLIDSKYKWLAIGQEDMECYRYRCIITDLKYTTYGKMPWAFTCTVTCDSQYAYTLPETFIYTVNSSVSNPYTINLYCPAAVKHYYPEIRIEDIGSTSVTIINKTDKGGRFEITNLSLEDGLFVNVNGMNQIITCSNNQNLYENFSGNFFRLVRGNNEINIIANATIIFQTEFPVRIGG